MDWTLISIIVGVMGGLVGAVGGITGAAVAIYNAVKGAKKTDVDILRTIISALSDDNECRKKENEDLEERLQTIETEKKQCLEALRAATAELEKFRKAIGRKGLLTA
jgi:septal ring factor EnvC (AmiA/AmiB activator)